MKRSLFVAVLGTLMILGLVSAGIAQTSESSSSAQSQQQATPDDKSSAPKADDSKSNAQAPPAPGSSSSTTTTVETRPGVRGDSAGSDVAASPRTSSSDTRRIFGLEPTAAVLVAAAILVVVVLALVAMTRGGSDTTSHTDIDINRRL